MSHLCNKQEVNLFQKVFVLRFIFLVHSVGILFVYKSIPQFENLRYWTVQGACFTSKEDEDKLGVKAASRGKQLLQVSSLISLGANKRNTLFV